MIGLRKNAKSITIGVSILCLACTIFNASKTSLNSSTFTKKIDNQTNRRLQTQDKAAIVALVGNNPTDLTDFCYAIISLRNLATDENYRYAPVIAFHEGISESNKLTLRKCTDRPLIFEHIKFELPQGFDPSIIEDDADVAQISRSGTAKGRPLWGYSQMIRFWTSLVYKQPALDSYDTIMRIDTDSCFKNGGDERDVNLPSMPSRFVYRSIPTVRGSGPKIEGLYDFTVDYMEENDISPANPKLWAMIEDVWRTRKMLATLQTNFEVSRMEFFRREDVRKWHDALTESEPFGVFRYRWGDAQTRVLTIAMFARPEEVISKYHPGYLHGKDKKLENNPSYCRGIIGDVDMVRELE